MRPPPVHRPGEFRKRDNQDRAPRFANAVAAHRSAQQPTRPPGTARADNQEILFPVGKAGKHRACVALVRAYGRRDRDVGGLTSESLRERVVYPPVALRDQPPILRDGRAHSGVAGDLRAEHQYRLQARTLDPRDLNRAPERREARDRTVDTDDHPAPSLCHDSILASRAATGKGHERPTC